MTFPGYILDPAPRRSQEEALMFAGSGQHFGVPCDSPEWLLLSKALTRNYSDCRPSCSLDPHPRAAKQTGMLVLLLLPYEEAVLVPCSLYSPSSLSGKAF